MRRICAIRSDVRFGYGALMVDRIPNGARFVRRRAKEFEFMKRSKKKRKMAALTAALGSSMLFGNGLCSGEIGREFRTAAGQNLQDGVLSIVTGIVNGAFAVIEPDANANDSTQ
jgi:hypothetical protein